jgi:hypothetical protein
MFNSYVSLPEDKIPVTLTNKSPHGAPGEALGPAAAARGRARCVGRLGPVRQYGGDAAAARGRG